MGHADDPKYLVDIEEDEFWRSLHAPAGAGPLATAIDLGLDGRTDEAYAALAEFHLTSLAEGREQAEKADLPSPEELAELTSQPLEELERLGAAASAAHRVALHMLSTGDDGPRKFLAALLTACYPRRNEVVISRYPFGSQLGSYNHFQLLWHSYLALLATGGIEPTTAAKTLKLVLAIGRALHRQAERYIVHNIFTAGSYGLFFIARTMSEFKEAEDWDERAVAHMLTDFERSFFSDGGHAERNWGYGAHTLGRLTRVYQHALKTGGLHGGEEEFAEGLRRGYRFFARSLGPKDLCPGFGDEGLRPMGYVLDKALASGVFPEGETRDLGVDRSRSELMEGTGIAVMRNGSGDDDVYANVTYGDFAGWHSHQDLLSMNLWGGGEVLLEEVPRFGPYEHPLDLLWRGPGAHSQLLVDGFFYDCRPLVGEAVCWHSDERFDFFSACHRAYRSVPPNEHRHHLLSDDLVVRRTIVFVKDPGYALVLDSVAREDGASFNRATSCWWHSPHGFEALGPGRARTSGTNACLLLSARPDTVRQVEIAPDFRPEDSTTGTHAPMYDQWHSLRMRTWMPVGFEGRLGFATLLFPFRGPVPDVAVTVRPEDGGVAFQNETYEIQTPRGCDVIALNPEKAAGPIDVRARIQLAGGPTVVAP